MTRQEQCMHVLESDNEHLRYLVDDYIKLLHKSKEENNLLKERVDDLEGKLEHYNDLIEDASQQFP